MVFAKLSTVLSAALLAGSALAVDPIVMKGTKFYFQNGTQFFIKGVAYQQGVGEAGSTPTNSSFIDPLADASLCKRDVPFLAALGTNVIRTYAIDPKLNHDACFALLQQAGIYVISDLSNPTISVNRDTPEWTVELYEHYKAVVDTMSKYNNVIGFFAGNEVTNNASNTPASAYVKAAVRDTKAYIKSKNIRWLGVGYAANDDSAIRANIAHYFNCGDPADAIDFWGYNIYEWCGQSSFQKSGYAEQVSFFKDYSVPVFFAEYGCNTVGGGAGRIFQETGALYSKDMTEVVSGGIVYMYFEEANDYGLVSIVGNSVSTMPAYNALKTQVAAATPASTASSAYNPTNSPAACPDISSSWEAHQNLPPKPDATTCQCMFNTLSCVPKPGLDVEQFGQIFGYICGQPGNLCSGISGNTSTGVYGAFSMCNAQEKLGFVLDKYYQSQKSSSSACDFTGRAIVTKAAGAAASCSGALSSASAANSIAATATKPASTSKGAAPGVRPTFAWAGLGDMAVGLYVAIAMGVGAGMVML